MYVDVQLSNAVEKGPSIRVRVDKLDGPKKAFSEAFVTILLSKGANFILYTGV